MELPKQPSQTGFRRLVSWDSGRFYPRMRCAEILLDLNLPHNNLQNAVIGVISYMPRVTALGRSERGAALPYRWNSRERRLGLKPPQLEEIRWNNA
jgi:hypothetical protein